jgi:hypothetical protein
MEVPTVFTLAFVLQTATTMFGVPLSEPAARLVVDVEAQYGKSIRQELVTTWEPSHYGESLVANDGTPVIKVNANTGRTEATIVHELLHLKLRTEGFASLAFELPPGKNTESNRTYLQWIGFHLRDPIQHWIVYPRMRAMGLDPDPELKTEFREAIRIGDFRGTNEITGKEARAMYYLKAALQIDDSPLLQQVSDWYQRKGWEDSLSIGREMTKLVLQAQPKSPSDEMRTFVKCANILLADTANFQFAGFQQILLGHHVQNVARIKVLPPPPGSGPTQ